MQNFFTPLYLVLDENKTKLRLQLRRIYNAPPTSIFLKWNLITKGRAASELEVAGQQHKKVWKALDNVCLYMYKPYYHLISYEGLPVFYVE